MAMYTCLLQQHNRWHVADRKRQAIAPAMKTRKGHRGAGHLTERCTTSLSHSESNSGSCPSELTIPLAHKLPSSSPVEANLIAAMIGSRESSCLAHVCAPAEACRPGKCCRRNSNASEVLCGRLADTFWKLSPGCVRACDSVCMRCARERDKSCAPSSSVCSESRRPSLREKSLRTSWNNLAAYSGSKWAALPVSSE